MSRRPRRNHAPSFKAKVVDLLQQLQHALGYAYMIERELGGGGMSRVFVARDGTLQRRVVITILPPDLVAGVNVEDNVLITRDTAVVTDVGIAKAPSASRTSADVSSTRGSLTQVGWFPELQRRVGR